MDFRTKHGPITDDMWDKDLPIDRNPREKLSPEARARFDAETERLKRMIAEIQATGSRSRKKS